MRRGAADQFSLFEDQHIASPELRQVQRNARARDAAANNDDFRSILHDQSRSSAAEGTGATRTRALRLHANNRRSSPRLEFTR